MNSRGLARWGFFALYLVALLALPPTILFFPVGAFLGLSAGVGLLLYLRFWGQAKIGKSLHLSPIHALKFPHLHNAIREYCWRLDLPEPELTVMEANTLNTACFGYHPKEAVLVYTRGALENLSRDELVALSAYLLLSLKSRTVQNRTWLASLLLLTESFSRKPQGPGKPYPFRLPLMRFLVYPLVLLPSVLLTEEIPADTSSLATRLCGNPRALVEALRKLDVSQHRSPLWTTHGLRNLFLAPTSTPDPMARILFPRESLLQQIKALESLLKTSPAGELS